MGDLPEQRDTNLRGVEQLQTKLKINMDALDKAETRRLLLQGQIAELQRQRSSSPAARPRRGSAEAPRRRSRRRASTSCGRSSPSCAPATPTATRT